MSRRGRDEHETTSEYYELGVSTVTKDFGIRPRRHRRCRVDIFFNEELLTVSVSSEVPIRKEISPQRHGARKVKSF
jgi:hypothetical protein